MTVTATPIRRRVGLLSVVLLVVGASCGGGSEAGLSGGGDSPGLESNTDAESATYQYTIPIGAGEAIDAGEPLEILPRELSAQVGETISIVNEDDRGHTIGPWFVGANESIRQQFTTAGSYAGTCTVHPSGEFILEVIDR